jgi:AbrB family looped-hinge helix DNA binding protein
MTRMAIPFDRATLGRHGRLTIPVGIRRWLGITPGTRLTVQVNAQGELVFRLLTPPSKEDTSL